MSNKTQLHLKLLEGRTFIIGREGHIYIDSSVASKNHAEIRITNGKILLRDLKSTNGTYLVKNNKLVFFESGEVTLGQDISIGGKIYSIHELLEVANDFVNSDDAETELDYEVPGYTGQKKSV
ncbi:MAG: FHA domain-containing protein [Gammaproteobacteria bacterium]|nr:FHA domain-containing protein [Gammaproteobacteria bacterium]